MYVGETIAKSQAKVAGVRKVCFGHGHAYRYFVSFHSRMSLGDTGLATTKEQTRRDNKNKNDCEDIVKSCRALSIPTSSDSSCFCVL